MTGKMFLILGFLGVSWSHAQNVIEVETSTKPIQRDGFLLEWRVDEAHPIDSTHDLRADAVNTSEGLSGYIRYSAADSCSDWSFRIYPRLGGWKRFLTINVDSSALPGEFYAMDRQVSDTATHISIEYVIPWDSLPRDSAGAYEAGFAPSSACEDTIRSFAVCGTYNPEPYGKVWSAGLVAQVLIIAVLLILYLIVRSRARKYSPGIREKNG